MHASFSRDPVNQGSSNLWPCINTRQPFGCIFEKSHCLPHQVNRGHARALG